MKLMNAKFDFHDKLDSQRKRNFSNVKKIQRTKPATSVSNDKPHHLFSLPKKFKLFDPSVEFSRTYYTKDHLEKVLLRNTLAPLTPQATFRNNSVKGVEKDLKKNSVLYRPPTEAFNKWRNEEKAHILYCEADIFAKEEEGVSFKRFDDAIVTNSSWMRGFEHEKTTKDIVLKQLEYNDKSKLALKQTMNNLRETFVKDLVHKIDQHEKKVDKMPQIKKKKKPKNFLAMSDDFGSFSGMDSSFIDDSRIKFTFFWSIIKNNLWKPGAREASTLAKFEDKIYLYGGKSNELKADLCELNIKGKLKVF